MSLRNREFLSVFVDGDMVAFAEYIKSVARELFSPELGLLDINGQVNSQRPNNLVEYRAAGGFLRMVLMSGLPMGIRLPASIAASLLGQSLVLQDIRGDEPALFERLSWFRSASADELLNVRIEFGRTAFGVTENRKDIIVRRLQCMFRSHFGEKMDAIVEGFTDVVDGAV